MAPSDIEKTAAALPSSTVEPNEVLVKLTLSIDGMTCAACPAGISRVVKAVPYVQEFSVSLLDKSSRMIVPRARIHEICEIIEDTGYDVQVVAAEDCQTHVSSPGCHRSVDLDVSGLHCDACPGRVKAHLTRLDWIEDVQVKEYKEAQQTIQLTYKPDPGNFQTIREIRQELEQLGFMSGIHHRPLSAEIADRKAQAEIHKYLLSVLASLVLAIPTFIIGIVIMNLAPAESHARLYIMSPVIGRLSRGVLALFILATPVEFGIAWLFHGPALRGLRGLWRLRNNRTPIWQRFVRFGSMNLLISLGVTIAYFSSLALLCISAREAYEGSTEDVTYFDSVVFLTLFILIGRFIEVNSKKKMKEAISLLGDMRPQDALLIIGNDCQSIPTSMLEIGDKCIVPLGSSPPVDGVIDQGATQFDESSLSGEARPVPKSVGDRIFAGTINTHQQVTMRVTSVAGSNVLDTIARVISEGTSHRAHIERFGDILTSYFVPVICFISVCVFALWLALSYGGVARADLDSTIFSLRFSISVFVIACPCGIGLAAPTASAVGSAICARLGILASGGSEAYADACKTAAVVFDKTGTLTMGEMNVAEVQNMHAIDISPHSFWSAVLLCELNSNHPIAKCLVRWIRARPNFEVDPEIELIENKEIAGQGLTAIVQVMGTRLEFAIGSQSMMLQNKMALDSLTGAVDGTSVFIAMRCERDDVMQCGYRLVLADKIRPEAPEVMQLLRARKIDCYLLTGDHVVAAHSIAAKVGVSADCVIAGVSPLEKRERLSELRQRYVRKGRVAFVGDGVNDAPALAAADVSISLSSASDIAISSASFILVNSDLYSIITLLDLSKLIYRRIKFNYGWAIIFNIVAIPIAAGVLYPYHHFVLSPAWASLAMALSSISVVMSSFALRLQAPAKRLSASR